MSMHDSILSYPRSLSLKMVDWDNGGEAEQKRGLLNVNRRSFDYWLLKLSEKKVQFSSETKLVDFRELNGGVRILVEKANKKVLVKARYLIGADGGFSSIRRHISRNENDLRFYVAVQEWMRSPKGIGDFTYFIYDNEINDYYSWLIPKGNYMIIGSFFQQGEDVRSKFQLFKNKVREKYGIHGIAYKREAGVSPRPLSLDEVCLGRGNVILVGEAACLVSPSTGEGISFALRSGMAAANALNSHFDSAFEKYLNLCEPLLEEVGEKIKRARALMDPATRKELLGSMGK
ncbi:MAG: FAD-dependent monooxygenase [Candidatus Aenigmarchaeota archaeon]|nr:FAD-dependent monooxygenase [Candidatus Aenigmarchaeota archaeon]